MGAMLRLNTSLRLLDIDHNRLTPPAIAALCRTALEFGLVHNLVSFEPCRVSTLCLRNETAVVMAQRIGRQVALAATLDLSNVDDDSEEFAATNIFGRHDLCAIVGCGLDMGLYG